MSDSKLIMTLIGLLEPYIEADFKARIGNFYQADESVSALGIRTKQVREISKQYYNAHLKSIPLEDTLELSEELLAKGLTELRVIGLDWASRKKKEFKAENWEKMVGWLEKYVQNWADCDNLCCGPLGELILKYPELVSKRALWTSHENRWLRRAASVCMIPGIRKNPVFLEPIFATSKALFKDEDHMVQKGFGWTLKVASTRHPETVLDFLRKENPNMQRLAFNYALEKYPKEVRLEFKLK